MNLKEIAIAAAFSVRTSIAKNKKNRKVKKVQFWTGIPMCRVFLPIFRSRGRPSRAESCGSSFCLVSKSRKNTFHPLHSFTCADCVRKVHSVCAFRFTDEDEYELPNTTAKCLDCSDGANMSHDTRKTLLGRLTSKIDAELQEDTLILQEAAELMEELENNLQKSSGPTRRRFEKALRSFGVDQRAWLQEFNGNSIRKILRSVNTAKLLAVFPPNPFITKIVMENLGYLMSSADTSAKTDSEIDEIESHVNSLVRNLRSAMPEAVVTPKLHLICSHLIP
ncbi:unnamed protein product [Caenorhabditis sp. 36 PRJEB53466]|nr:unnamed protein product [Caenorhabditis sp. 36 PRJEB53466]